MSSRRSARCFTATLDLDIRVYAKTHEWNDFYAIREDVLFRIKDIVGESGTGFAFPSQTLYVGRDGGMNAHLSRKAKEEVASWRRTGQLPFPRLAASRIKELAGRLKYPPPGSPDFNASEEDLADAGGERLSAESWPNEEPAQETQTLRPAAERI
jgi:MscS family membrane protein